MELNVVAVISHGARVGEDAATFLLVNVGTIHLADIVLASSQALVFESKVATNGLVGLVIQSDLEVGWEETRWTGAD